ncbi:hypothetical protein AB0N20_35320, partial [Streptomyces griseoincarnatus]
MTPRQAEQLACCAAVFEPGDPARTGRVAFWDPDGGTPPPAPGGEPGEADLVVPDGDGFAVRTVPVLRLTPAGVLGYLFSSTELRGLFDRLGYDVDDEVWRRTVD